MQLRRVTVSNWRGVESTAIEFDQGITIIGGRNESGKSTIREALRAAYLSPQKNEQKKSIERKRPWGTVLYPSVIIEFLMNGTEWEVKKEFLRKKDWAHLRQAGRLLALDEDVQPRLLKELGDKADWIDTLWASQGDVLINKPIPESVKGCLAVSAKDSVMPEVRRLEQLIENLYAEYWTPTKRVKGTVQNARKDTELKKQRVNEAKAYLEEATLAAERVEALKVSNEKRHLTRTVLIKRLELGRSQIAQWNQYRQAIQNADALKTQYDKIQSLVLSSNTQIHECIQQQPKTESWKSRVAVLKADLIQRPSFGKIDTLKKRLAFVDLLQKYAEQTEIMAIQAPNESETRSLLELNEQLTEVSARLGANELRASVVAEADFKFELQSDDRSSEEISLSKSESRAWAAEREINVSIPGVARFRIEAGSQSVQADAELRDNLREKIEKALRDWSATSVQELQERFVQKQTRLKTMTEVKETALLSAEADVADSAQLKLLSKEQRIDLIEVTRQEIIFAEQQFTTLNAEFDYKQSELNQLIQENLLADLKLKLTKLQLQVQAIKLLVQDTAEVLKGREPALSACERTSDFLIAAAARCQDSPATDSTETNHIDLNSLSELQTALSEFLCNVLNAEKSMRENNPRPEGDEVTMEILQKIETEVQEVNVAIEHESAALNQSIGAIKNPTPLYTNYVEAFESLNLAKLQEEQTDLDAQSSLILKEAFEHAKKKLQETVLTPLQSRITARLKDLTKNLYREATLDDTLKVVAVVPQHVDAVDVDEISFGTKEQLTFLCRLSLAELLTESTERLTVILDDNLVHSDQVRMNTICSMLELASENIQIVIFTCHPERYETIKHKKLVMLSEPPT